MVSKDTKKSFLNTKLPGYYLIDLINIIKSLTENLTKSFPTPPHLLFLRSIPSSRSQRPKRETSRRTCCSASSGSFTQTRCSCSTTRFGPYLLFADYPLTGLFVMALRPRPDPINKIQHEILLYAGIGPSQSFFKDHVTDAIDRIPA